MGEGGGLEVRTGQGSVAILPGATRVSYRCHQLREPQEAVRSRAGNHRPICSHREQRSGGTALNILLFD
jgi:hypothetical protein